MKGGVSCVGKRAYQSHRAAKLMADRTNEGRDCHVAQYRCRFCQQWHVGTSMRKKDAKRRRLAELLERELCAAE